MKMGIEQARFQFYYKGKSEIEGKTSIEPKSYKNVQTLDIDHFWEAFVIEKCKTH